MSPSSSPYTRVCTFECLAPICIYAANAPYSSIDGFCSVAVLGKRQCSVYSSSNPLPVLISALVLYDYLISLDQEVNLFWKRKFTGATVLFLLNKYLLVLSNILSLASTERSSDFVS